MTTAKEFVLATFMKMAIKKVEKHTKEAQRWTALYSKYLAEYNEIIDRKYSNEHPNS